jgi:hypothetical protein
MRLSRSTKKELMRNERSLILFAQYCETNFKLMDYLKAYVMSFPAQFL